MASDITGDLAAAGGMPNMDGLLEVEMIDELSEVVGIGIEIISVPRLAGPAVAAPVMGDAPVAVRHQEKHLIFKRVGAERPPVAEDDGLTRAPIVVVDLRTVLSRKRGHDRSFLSADDSRLGGLAGCHDNRCGEARQSGSACDTD